MITIGVEGVSCTGKTTLARALAERLTEQAGSTAALPGRRGEVCVVPCYHHAAPDPTALSSREIRTEADQLALLTTHLKVEQLRARQARNALDRGHLVVLDRTADTLIAHLRAVGLMRGLDATVEAHRLVTAQIERGQVALPTVTLLLQTDHEVLARRAQARPGMPPLSSDSYFAPRFNGHFADPITPHCLVIDATGRPDELLEQAYAMVKPYLDGAR
jgi:thymidylate kinase